MFHVQATCHWGRGEARAALERTASIAHWRRGRQPLPSVDGQRLWQWSLWHCRGAHAAWRNAAMKWAFVSWLNSLVIRMTTARHHIGWTTLSCFFKLCVERCTGKSFEVSVIPSWLVYFLRGCPVSDHLFGCWRQRKHIAVSWLPISYEVLE